MRNWIASKPNLSCAGLQFGLLTMLPWLSMHACFGVIPTCSSSEVVLFLILLLSFDLSSFLILADMLCAFDKAENAVTLDSNEPQDKSLESDGAA